MPFSREKKKGTKNEEFFSFFLALSLSHLSFFSSFFFFFISQTTGVCFCVVKKYSNTRIRRREERAFCGRSLVVFLKRSRVQRRGREEHSATDDDYDEIHSTTLFL